MSSRTSSQDHSGVWLILYLLFGTLVLWSSVVEETAFGQIYQVIFFFSIIVYLLSKVTGQFAEFQNLNRDNITLQLLAGFGLGLALVGTLFQVAFPQLSPLSTPSGLNVLGILGFEALSQVFLMSMVVAELEETFRTCSLRPTLAEWMEDEHSRTVFLAATSAILWMVLPVHKWVGFLVFAGTMLTYFSDIDVTDYFDEKLVRHGLAIVVAGAFFAILHLKAYGGTEYAQLENTAQLLSNAFLFAVIADTINYQFNSATPSKVAHCLNNATVASVSKGLPAIMGLLVTVVYASILFVMSRGTIEDLRPQNVLKGVSQLG